MFDDIKKIVVAGAALLALVPAASLIGGLIAMPPDFNRFLTFTAGVMGPVVLFATFAVRRQLGRLRLAAMLSVIGSTALLGLALAWLTYSYSVERIEEVPYRQTDGSVETVQYFKPETLSAELHGLVNDEFGGLWRYAIVDVDHGARVRELMKTQSLPDQRKLILLLNSAQALLIFSFLTAAFLVADRKRRASGSADRKARRPE